MFGQRKRRKNINAMGTLPRKKPNKHRARAAQNPIPPFEYPVDAQENQILTSKQGKSQFLEKYQKELHRFYFVQ